MDAPSDAGDLIAQFCSITNESPDTARQTLQQRNWNLEEAVDSYFHPQNSDNDEDFDDDEPAQASGPTPAQPSAAASNAPGKKKATGGGNPKRMTLDDLKKREEDSGDDEDDKNQDMFAGGEKSGLAVQNPGQGGGPVDHFKNIMNQAKQNRDRPTANDEDADTAQQGSSNFVGRAQTLGGDDAESQVVEDPQAMQRSRQQALPRVTRTLHLWADGVSIDDGPLFRFDDPANANIMAEINRGRAPLALLDVAPDQEVDLNLEPHKDENYVQPKAKYKPFSGSGQRLGSPVPTAGTSTAASAPATSTSSNNATPNLDESAPTIQLQIRLADGTRLPSRFNTTHNIGDVYAFVNAASPASAQRSYVLQTTFPTKEFEDKSVVLGDIGEFKRGGVVVQKWK